MAFLGKSVRLPLLLALFASAWLAPRAAADLSAEELVLIVNRNAPEGRALADYYQQARGVPDGRVIELDLTTDDWLPRDDWDEKVVAPVRQFLDQNGLKERVRCAVTFYGVPLGVEGLKSGDEWQKELREIDAAGDVLLKKFVPLVRRAEHITYDLGDKPPAWPRDESNTVEEAMRHLQLAQQFLNRRLPTLDEAQRREIGRQVAELQAEFDAPLEAGGKLMTPQDINPLLGKEDADGRRAARDALRTGGTLAQYAAVLVQQQRRLDDDQSDACFDSELSTLWSDGSPRARWLANPLAQPGRGNRGVLMVARLDGRDPNQIRRLIDSGIAVERDGLDGKIVIDARGLPARKEDGSADAYGLFDQQLRDLAGLLRADASLPLVLDDRPEVISSPGEEDVAVYVGWYSVQNYVRGLRFARGAVGYHVASYEMKSLRNPSQLGWVRGLLDDGVAATLGPVSEPYLSTFPPPERFVPLLLSGELPLGEVYWRTTPVLSWKMGLIGDPLYRPFTAKPAFPRASLPADVAALLD